MAVESQSENGVGFFPSFLREKFLRNIAYIRLNNDAGAV